mgnify:CR=1 FL=1
MSMHVGAVPVASRRAAAVSEPFGPRAHPDRCSWGRQDTGALHPDGCDCRACLTDEVVFLAVVSIASAILAGVGYLIYRGLTC